MKKLVTAVFLALTAVGLGLIYNELGKAVAERSPDLLKWLIGLTVFFALGANLALVPELGHAIADVVRAWRGKNGATGATP